MNDRERGVVGRSVTSRPVPLLLLGSSRFPGAKLDYPPLPCPLQVDGCPVEVVVLQRYRWEVDLSKSVDLWSVPRPPVVSLTLTHHDFHLHAQGRFFLYCFWKGTAPFLKVFPERRTSLTINQYSRRNDSWRSGVSK